MDYVNIILGLCLSFGYFNTLSYFIGYIFQKNWTIGASISALIHSSILLFYCILVFMKENILSFLYLNYYSLTNYIPPTNQFYPDIFFNRDEFVFPDFLLMILSSGYFISDFIFVSKVQRNFLMQLHHILALFSYVAFFTYNGERHLFFASLFLGECTSPLYNLKQICQALPSFKTHISITLTYRLLSYIFICSFLCIRLVYYPFIFIPIYFFTRVSLFPLLFKFGAYRMCFNYFCILCIICGFLLGSIFWSFQMMKRICISWVK